MPRFAAGLHHLFKEQMIVDTSLSSSCRVSISWNSASSSPPVWLRLGGDGLALRFQPQPGAALALGADTQIGHEPPWRGGGGQGVRGRGGRHGVGHRRMLQDCSTSSNGRLIE